MQKNWDKIFYPSELIKENNKNNTKTANIRKYNYLCDSFLKSIVNDNCTLRKFIFADFGFFPNVHTKSENQAIHENLEVLVATISLLTVFTKNILPQFLFVARFSKISSNSCTSFTSDFRAFRRSSLALAATLSSSISCWVSISSRYLYSWSPVGKEKIIKQFKGWSTLLRGTYVGGDFWGYNFHQTTVENKKTFELKK